MTLETDAQAAEADATKVAAAVEATGIFSKLKTGIVFLVTSAGSLLTTGSALLKGLTIAAIMAIPAGAYFKGRSDANHACIAKAAKAHAKNVKAYANTKKHVDKMGKSQLDSSLSKWVQ